MRVRSVVMYCVRIPLRREIRHASHVRLHTDSLIVRVTLANGVVGYGEGLPRDYVTGETLDISAELLRKTDLKGQLGKVADWDQALLLIGRLKLPEVPGDDRKCVGNAARCALEIALLDAYGRHFGQSLGSIAAKLAPELAQNQSEVRYGIVITSSSGWKLGFKAFGYRLYRFRQAKLKVGIEGKDDVSRIATLRRWGGEQLGIRLDANEAWTTEVGREILEKTKTFGIQWVEQPLPHENCADLFDFRRETGTAIMLDESLCSMEDAKRAVAGGWCDLFNLRLSKCGGFLPSLALARFAHQNGISCQLGCQVGETAILSAAGRLFAQSVSGLKALEGSYDRHLVTEALGKRDLTFGWGGKAPALSGPGLGVDIREDALVRVTQLEETILG
ncbi:MAG: dipeptide epimerase [Planctomycetota bacterium]|nr:dipeptide epimerase [Planctomycetota bacterium]